MKKTMLILSLFCLVTTIVAQKGNNKVDDVSLNGLERLWPIEESPTGGVRCIKDGCYGGFTGVCKLYTDGTSSAVVQCETNYVMEGDCCGVEVGMNW